MLVGPEKRTASAMSSDEASAVIIDGSSSRSSIRLPARLRLWPSSPICSIWATIDLTSIGPALRTACWSSGPSTEFIQCSRSITSGP